MSLGWAPNAKAGTGSQRTLVYLFFPGGMDCLNLLIPRTGQNRADYDDKRPNIGVPTGSVLNLNGDFGFHPGCTELQSHYQAGNLAVVHACGMPPGLGSRSHFDSREMFELGTPGTLATVEGWLSRYIHTAPNIPASAIVPSMAAGNPPVSQQGDYAVMSLDDDPSSFHPNAGRYAEEHMATLAQMYDGVSEMDQSVQGAIDTINIISNLDLTVPGSYPNTSLADDLGLIAQVVKADLGVQVATLSYGGWDTHENQGDNGGGNFSNKMNVVSEAIGAFLDDLQQAGRLDDVVLVTQTEFGRRVRENGNRGTDHGTGQVMMVAGGQVQGGQIFGTFPGIADSDLYLNTDLAMTTDYRRVLSDVVLNFMGNPEISTIFPGYTGSTQIGLFPTETIFASGFE
ncbi:MAG: DUF1501 domain-containing protein [bacterium]